MRFNPEAMRGLNAAKRFRRVHRPAYMLDVARAQGRLTRTDDDLPGAWPRDMLAALPDAERPLCEMQLEETGCHATPCLATDVHHKRTRRRDGRKHGALGDRRYYVACCDACRQYVQAHPAWALVTGWSEPPDGEPPMETCPNDADTPRDIVTITAVRRNLGGKRARYTYFWRPSYLLALARAQGRLDRADRDIPGVTLRDKLTALGETERPLCEMRLDATGCQGEAHAASEIHHRRSKRGHGSRLGALNDTQHFVACCHACHAYVERHPSWAREHGWTEAPDETPRRAPEPVRTPEPTRLDSSIRDGTRPTPDGNAAANWVFGPPADAAVHALMAEHVRRAA